MGIRKEQEPQGPLGRLQENMPDDGERIIEGLLCAYLGVELVVEEEEIV